MEAISCYNFNGAKNSITMLFFLRKKSELVYEGNLIFLIQMGLMCHVKEIVRALAISLEKSLLSELELYDRVTEEEFEVVRLSKAERKKEIIKNINVRTWYFYNFFVYKTDVTKFIISSY